jgi:hypothetical protein
MVWWGFAALFLPSSNGFAQPQGPEMLWFRNCQRVTDSSKTCVWDAIPAADGGFMLAATGQDGQMPRMVNARIIFLAANGDLLNTNVYAVWTGIHRVHAIETTGDGGWIAGGCKGASVACDHMSLMAFPGQGGADWYRDWTINGFCGTAEALRALPDRGYIVCGDMGSPHGPCLYLARIDSIGDTLWTRMVCSDSLYSGDHGWDVRVTRDGGFIACGGANWYADPIEHYDAYLVRLNSSGDILWTRTFGSADVDEVAYAVCETSDGGFLAVGRKGFYSGSGTGTYIVRTDADGERMWERSSPPGAISLATDVVIAADGLPVILGSLQGASEDTTADITLTKITADGDTVWAGRYAVNGYAEPKVLLRTNDGGYLAGGGCRPSVNSDAERPFAARFAPELGASVR